MRVSVEAPQHVGMHAKIASAHRHNLVKSIPLVKI
jgi:hypothetical protein